MAERHAKGNRSARAGTATRPSVRENRLREIAALAAREGWTVVDEVCWRRLREQFPELSERTLRHDLRQTGLPVSALVEGVRLDTLEHLARTLLALAAQDSQERQLQPQIRISPARRLVLEARRTAETVLRNPRIAPEKRAAMEEKFLWIRTWLENPAVFPTWAPLRLRKVRNPELDERHP
jgi:hypothetical protein